MSEIKLHKRVKYAGDVHAELLKLGWDCETAALFCDNIPDADAVEVVRCKYCIHWLNEDGLEDHVCLKIYSDAGVHSVAWLSRKPDDFCSDGKRRSHHDSLCDQTEEDA